MQVDVPLVREHAPADLFELAQRTRSPETLWLAGMPLSHAKNAHSTNTKEHMEEALKEGYNYLEGDLRTEINPPYALEMRHDKGHESGDNLTFAEWLEVGKASGRGLKIDVKEGDRMPDILDALEESGIPTDRLMLNLGDGDLERWGSEIRRRFPDMLVAVNPTDRLGEASNEDGPMEAWQIDRMLAHAEALGGPVTFVIRFDRLTDEAIRRLQEVGPVSIWNSPGVGGMEDVEEEARTLRDRGVAGVIDLRPSYGLGDKAEFALDKAKNWAKGWIDKLT